MGKYEDKEDDKAYDPISWYNVDAVVVVKYGSNDDAVK